MPKYYWILMMAEVRHLLWSVGMELAQSGRLDSAEDIFFLDLPDARQALGGTDFPAVVCERRDRYKQEIGRCHIPAFCSRMGPNQKWSRVNLAALQMLRSVGSRFLWHGDNEGTCDHRPTGGKT